MKTLRPGVEIRNLPNSEPVKGEEFEHTVGPQSPSTVLSLPKSKKEMKTLGE